MNIKFDSVECRNIAADLKKSASTLDSLITGDLKGAASQLAEAYQSGAASELNSALNKMASKITEFNEAIDRCADYLTNTVAPAYDDIERTIGSKIG